MLVQYTDECGDPESLDAEFKLCRPCAQYRPITAFRLRKKGESARHAECNECRNAHKRAKNESRRQTRLRQCLSKINRARSPGEMEICVGLICAQFGGVEQFSAYCHDAAQQASAEGRTRDSLRLCDAIIRLVIAADAKRPAINLEGLDDQDIENALLKMAPEAEEREPASEKWDDAAGYIG